MLARLHTVLLKLLQGMKALVYILREIKLHVQTKQVEVNPKSNGVGICQSMIVPVKFNLLFSFCYQVLPSAQGLMVRGASFVAPLNFLRRWEIPLSCPQTGTVRARAGSLNTEVLNKSGHDKTGKMYLVIS